MKEETIKQLAQQAGFNDAAVISTDELYFIPEYREYCVQNLCGNYDRNYGCPPYCGTPEEMKEKTCRSYYCKLHISRICLKVTLEGSMGNGSYGCESKYRTPILEKRVCPQCGKEVEVFTNRGRIMKDTICSCGHDNLFLARPETQFLFWQ